jgi:hypothetical protein
MYYLESENHKDTLNHFEIRLLKALSGLLSTSDSMRIEISRINELFNKIRRLSREETHELLLKFKSQGLIKSWTRFGIVLDYKKIEEVLFSWRFCSDE